MTQLNKTVFLYDHTEDCRIEGRNMLLNIFYINKNASQN